MCAEPGRGGSEWPAGVTRIVLAEVDSTNAEGARRAGTLTRPTWILAGRQTAGRGRRGRPWVMPEGNFAATLVLRPSEPAGTVALRSFVAALAVFDAVAAVTGRTEGLAVKWPNDVLLNGGKLAGILLESAGAGSGVSHLAVGIGVNLAIAPLPADVGPGALRPVSLAAETGVRISAEAFLDQLAPAFAAWDARLASDGFAPIRSAWLARAARLGQEITARTGTQEFRGRFETLTADGALVLVTAAGGWVSLPAADVFF